MSKEKNAVLDYLEKVNRPYSANDILQNLHKEFGKSAILKALDKLVAENKVHEKTYGKQKVYAIVQKESGNLNDVQNELQKLETQLLEKTELLRKTEQDLKQSQDLLNGYRSTLTTEEAQSEKNKVMSEVEIMESNLAKLSANTVLITEADRQKIKKKYETAVKEYKKRKRISMDILNSILESYPKSKSTLIEEIGMELDDENNVPPIQ